MSRNVRTYDHFCVLARALERLGDRWTLLVVRDLVSGPKRFTDLMDRLGGITPKTLTQRLRELDDAGVVQADRTPGRREVWYQLTPAGLELKPVIEELAWWGWRHAASSPGPAGGQRLHPEHLLLMLRVLLEHGPRLRTPARWHLRFVDDGVYTLATDGTTWTLTSSAPSGAVDVTVVATTAAWLSYILDPTAERAEQLGVDIMGSAAAVRRFQRVMRTFPDALAAQSASAR